MPKGRPYYYLVDGLTDEKAAIMRKGLEIIPTIYEVMVSVPRSTVEVRATRDVADQVRVACDVARVKYRTRAKL